METHRPLLSPHLVLVLQLLLWWFANNVYALHAQSLLQDPAHSPHLYLYLTLIQLSTGFILAKSFLHVFHPSSSHLPTTPTSPLPSSSPSQTYSSPIFLFAALAHLTATTLTNASYRAIGATATLVWKLVEPLCTILLKYLLLKQLTPFVSLLGLHTVLAGVLLFSANTLSLPALSPILIANLAFPLRNVLLKRTQLQHPHPTNTQALFRRFAAMCAPTALAASSFLACKFLVQGPVALPLPSLLVNALLFNTYQLTSLALLEKLDPLTHSLANTLKRFSAILVAVLYTGQTLFLAQLVGLAMTVLGFPVYVFGPNLSKRLALRLDLSSRSRRSVMVAFLLFLLVVLVAFAAIVMLIVPASDLRSLHQYAESQFAHVPQSVTSHAEKAPVSSRQDAPWHAAVDDVVIFVDPKYRRLPNVVVRDYAEAKRIDDGDNTGNFVWQHAAFVSLPDFSMSVTCNESYAECHEQLVEGTNKRFVAYRPGANYFNPKRVGSFAADLETLRIYNGIPLLVGIGLQLHFQRNAKKVDLIPGGTIETTPADFEFSDNALLLLDLLEERKYPMLFRGDFTLQAVRLAGYSRGFSTGCPTLFLNEEVELGKQMEEKYEALGKRIGDTSLRVAINVKEGAKFMELVRSILERYPNSYVYAQGRGDMIYLEKSAVPFERVRLFTNVEAWRDSLAKMDLSIGARIHGNMLALAAKVPVYVIAPDHRVRELARRMRIPHTTYFGNDLPGPETDLAELLADVGFDGEEFDRTRCEIAKVYRKVFRRYGFDVARHVRAVSEHC